MLMRPYSLVLAVGAKTCCIAPLAVAKSIIKLAKDCEGQLPVCRARVIAMASGTPEICTMTCTSSAFLHPCKAQTCN